MRAICITITLLGLLLMGLSVWEITQVRAYRAELQKVKHSMLELDNLNTPPNVVRFQSPSTESMLAPLDNADKLEMAWLIASLLGVAVFITGIIGLRRESLRQVLNQMHELHNDEL